MKKLAFIFLAFFGVFALQAQAPLNWIADTDVEPFQESTNVYEGTYSCGIMVNSGVQGDCDFDSDAAIAVNAGDTFKMSFWGYTSEFVRGRAKLVLSDGSNFFATTYLGPNTGGWEQFIFEGEVPADITTVNVGIRFYDVAGFVPGDIQYLDDFVFESPIGTPHVVDNGDFEQWSGLTPEPTNYPTDFSGEAVGLGAALSWTDAVGAQLPSAYLIKASTEDNIGLPEDGVYLANDLDLSDGTGAANVLYGEEGFSFPNLEGSTTYYFKIFPYSNSGANVDYKTDGTVPSAQVETSDLVNILFTTFDNGWGNWTSYSVTGDQVWVIDDIHGLEGTPCAKMSGFAGASNENEDWLISPLLDLGNYSNENLSFFSAVGYTGPALQVKVSSDYDGVGNPNDFTWEDFTDQAQWPPSGSFFEYTNSGALDISYYTDQSIHIAFVFYSTEAESATWELDNILLTGEGQYIPDPEPSNYPADFVAIAQGQNISLTWTDAIGTQLPAGYLVLASDNGAFTLPVDGEAVANDPDLSDGSAVLNIGQGLEACAFNNLEAPITYHFAIFPYTNSGEFIDYKTDGTYPSTEATTVPVSYLLFTDFNDDWGGWTPVSVVGDQVWSRDNTYGLEGTPCALMTGYSGGNFENEDWLISPELDFSATTNEVLRFYSARSYVGPDLLLKASTDYDGGGDPTSATWTDISDQVNWSTGSFIWTESGAVSLSQFSGNTVYLAYQFFSTATNSSNWEIDNVELTQEELTGEPTNYPMSFTATAYEQTITLTWDDATGEILPEMYLIKADNQNVIALPVDEVPEANDANLADGQGAMNIEYGLGTYTFIGLEANTTYYFKIFPYTNSGTLIDYKTDGTPPTANATTEENPFTEFLFTTFDDGWEGWEQISVLGDQVWSRDNAYGIEDTPCASMTGYSGSSFANQDWLISPDIELGMYDTEEQLIFYSAAAYSGLPLQVLIANDYNGDLSTATWDDLSEQVIWPEEGSFFEWTNSGVVDISNWRDNVLNIAFVYQSSDEESATWEIDNVRVQAIHLIGTNEIDKPKQLSIYPNPGNGIFNIQSANTIQSIQVYSLTGALMAQQKPDNAISQMDLSQLNPGIYFARISDGEGNIITRKIVIE